MKLCVFHLHILCIIFQLKNLWSTFIHFRTDKLSQDVIAIFYCNLYHNVLRFHCLGLQSFAWEGYSVLNHTVRKNVWGRCYSIINSYFMVNEEQLGLWLRKVYMVQFISDILQVNFIYVYNKLYWRIFKEVGEKLRKHWVLQQR